MEALDGNAAAGVLSEVFALEITSARARCDGCGMVAQIGEARAYVEAPGVVLRCSGCGDVLLVLVRRGTRYVLAAQGMTWLELSPG